MTAETPITLHQLCRALAAHAVLATPVGHVAREVAGNPPDAPPRPELIAALAEQIEAAARQLAANVERP